MQNRFLICLSLLAFLMHSAVHAEGLYIKNAYRGGPRPEVIGSYNYDEAYPGEFSFGYRLPVLNSFIADADEEQIIALILSKENLDSEDLNLLSAFLKPYRLRLQLIRRGKVYETCKESLLLGYSSSLNGRTEEVVVSPDVSWVGIKNGKVSSEDRGTCRDLNGRKFVPQPQNGDVLRLVRNKGAKKVTQGVFKPIKNNDQM